MNPPVPARTCPDCGEYLPHACAPIIAFRRQRYTGKRVLTITDRPSPVLLERAS